MANDCENCTKCLDYVDAECIKYTGKSYPNVGVNNGDNIVQVLEKISIKLEELEGNQEESQKCD